MSRLLCLAVISDVTSYLGATEHAPWLYDALLPFAGRLAVIHPGITAVAPIDQCLGQLSALLGDRGRSEVHFDAAMARCREIGARTLEEGVQNAYAESLLVDDGDAVGVKPVLGLEHPPSRSALASTVRRSPAGRSRGSMSTHRCRFGSAR